MYVQEISFYAETFPAFTVYCSSVTCWAYQCVRRVVTLVVTAQTTMSFCYELACKGHSAEKAQDLVT